jgi:hypothetical protein
LVDHVAELMVSVGEKPGFDVGAALAQSASELLCLRQRVFAVLLPMQNEDAAVKFAGHIFNYTALLKHPFARPHLPQNGQLGAKCGPRPEFDQIVGA